MLKNMRILKDINTLDTFTLNPTRAEELKVINGQKTMINFGIKKVEVVIRVAEHEPTNGASLSFNTIKTLSLQINSLFDFKLNGNELLIGPFVGILAANTKEQLNNKLRRLALYCKYYDVTRGVLLFFSLEGLNMKNREISGFTYNPESGKWDSGIFPYPSAIYRNVSLKKSIKEHLNEHIGNRLFNSHYISKWDMYKRLQKNKLIRDYIPKTYLYIGPEGVLNLLKSQATLYIKPLFGLKGKGIKELSIKQDRYSVRFREKEENKVLDFSESAFIRYLQETFETNKFIVQHRLDLIFEEFKMIDFRVFTTKDEAGQWSCLGWVARHGVVSSIVSNRSNGGKIKSGNDTLQQLFQLDKKSLYYWREDLFQIACEASKTLENETENFGFFAIDMAVDTKGDFWILEMNHRSPNDKLPLYIKDIELYNNIKKYKLLYLRYLAGF